MNDMQDAPTPFVLQPLIEQIDECMHVDPDTAIGLCQQAFERAREEKDAFGHVLAVERYAKIMDHQGRAAESRNKLFEALQIAESMHLFQHEARLQELIARSYYTSGEYRTAIQYWVKCIEVADREGDDPSTSMLANIGLGQVYDVMGDSITAIRLHSVALNRIDEVDDPYLEAKIKINLGYNLMQLEYYSSAALCLEEALEICLKYHFVDYAAESNNRLAEVDMRIDAWDSALVHLEAALLQAREVEYRWAEANILANLAAVYAHRGDYPNALATVAAAKKLTLAHGFLQILIRLHFSASRYAEESGDVKMALAELREGHEGDLKIQADSASDRRKELEAKAGLRSTSSRLLAVLSNHPLLEASQSDDALRLIAREGCKILEVERSSVWMFDIAADELSGVYQYNANTDSFGEPVLLRSADCPSYFEWLDSPVALVAHNAEHHHYTWELFDCYLNQRDVKSLLSFAIRIPGRVAGVLSFEHVGKQRNWTPDEVVLGGQLADFAARALASQERAQFQHQINGLNLRLMQTNEILEVRVKERTAMLESANTELHEVMDKLVQSEKLASLGSLVAGIAHEMNTPLSSVLLSASTLSEVSASFKRNFQQGKILKSDLEKFIDDCNTGAELIERNAARAGDLISNFKQVAVDTSSTRRRKFDLKQTIGEVMAMLGPQFRVTGHRISVSAPDNVEMESYPGPLAQIITNLATNSLLHGFEGRENGEIKITAEREGEDKIRLIYEDNGHGIPESLHKRVFDPFFTTRLGTGGSGLGLYIVFNLVTGILGGELTLLSEPDKFTRFDITLPIHCKGDEAQ